MKDSILLPVDPDRWSNRLDVMMHDIAEQTLTFCSITISILGLIFLIFAVQQPSTVTLLPSGIICIFVAGVGFWLRKVSYPVAAWLTVVSLFAVFWWIILEAVWPPMILMLAVITGLGLVLISRPAGVAFATVTSIGLILLPASAAVSDLKWAAFIMTWAVIGLLLLSLRPLLQLGQWAWFGYEQSQEALHTAQEFQVELLQRVDELKYTNEQLTRLNRLAQTLRHEADEERMAKEQFVANVSHELRTPLNMIIGFCDMILRNPDLYGKRIKPSLLADLNVIYRNSQHLSELIDDVLDLSRIEANQLALSKEYISVGEVVEAAMITVRPLYNSKGLFLDAEVADDLPPLFADRTRIREVLINLLSNAGRFTEKGGVKVSVAPKDGSLWFAVQDTGQGIAPEDQARVFEPFQQVDGTLRRRNGGTGLGLSISRKIVEMHNGRMWVESTPGEGSIFSFTLPMIVPHHTERSALRWINPNIHYEDLHIRPRNTDHVEYHPRLVVVENEVVLSRLLKRYASNTAVDVFSHLEDAFIDMGRNPAAALIINESGQSPASLEFLPNLPHDLPVMVFSIPGSGKTAGALGVTDYLVKPVSRDLLLARIEKLGSDIRNILIVDDEQDALQLFSRILNEANPRFRVLRAADGHQALDILAKEAVDLVLLDLTMPGMSGEELLSTMKQDERLRAIPVFISSAYDPLKEPIISSSITVTTRNGLSSRDILVCIEVISRILAKTKPSIDPMFSTDSPA